MNDVRAIEGCLETIRCKISNVSQQLLDQLTDAQGDQWTAMVDAVDCVYISGNSLLANGVTAINYESHHILIAGLLAAMLRTTLPGWSSRSAINVAQTAFYTSSALRYKLSQDVC